MIMYIHKIRDIVHVINLRNIYLKVYLLTNKIHNFFFEINAHRRIVKISNNDNSHRTFLSVIFKKISEYNKGHLYFRSEESYTQYLIFV